jgi:hypothetical protein
MRSFLVSAAAAALVLATFTAPNAAVKDISYPVVKVELAEAYKPDAAFEKFQQALSAAVSKKDAQALFGLVGPTFLWMSQGEISEEFDYGRDAQHNFRVVFGFREYGKNADGPVQDGPFWDTLAEFAKDKTFYLAAANLVCGPTAASLTDDAAFERVKQRIGADDTVEWYFTVADAPATPTPQGGGAPVGRVTAAMALPVLNAFPPQEVDAPPPVTHIQVLLPLGKRGWIPISAARPLVTDHLCYAAGANGDWKIATFDQAG